jgi:hypothetical protein
MSKEIAISRFSPESWVTMRATGEHVKVEGWSPIAGAYRVRSRKHGLQFATEVDLVEVCAHPEADAGRRWSRCQAPRCGAPLTPELPLCPQCGVATCTCGRCQCVAKRSTAKRVRAKAPSKGG